MKYITPASWLPWVAVVALPHATMAQLMVTELNNSGTLTPSTILPAPYTGFGGIGFFQSVIIDRLNPFHLSVLGSFVLNQADPEKPAPGAPVLIMTLARGSTPLSQVPVSFQPPVWETSVTDGTTNTVLLRSFFSAISLPTPNPLTPGTYSVRLGDGANTYASMSFELATSTPLPPISIQQADHGVRVSWQGPEQSGFVALQRSSDLKTWTTVGFYLRAGSEVDQPASSESSFFRLTSQP